MSAIKYGEKNVSRKIVPQEHPERAGQMAADWEKRNQGNSRKGPGHQGNQAYKDDAIIKTRESDKRYLLRD